MDARRGSLAVRDRDHEHQVGELTQEERALISGVDRVTIARLETGAARAKPETARRLARALKVKPEDLSD